MLENLLALLAIIINSILLDRHADTRKRKILEIFKILNCEDKMVPDLYLDICIPVPVLNILLRPVIYTKYIMNDTAAYVLKGMEMKMHFCLNHPNHFIHFYSTGRSVECVDLPDRTHYYVREGSSISVFDGWESRWIRYNKYLEHYLYPARKTNDEHNASEPLIAYMQHRIHEVPKFTKYQLNWKVSRSSQCKIGVADQSTSTSSEIIEKRNEDKEVQTDSRSNHICCSTTSTDTDKLALRSAKQKITESEIKRRRLIKNYEKQTFQLTTRLKHITSRFGKRCEVRDNFLPELPFYPARHHRYTKRRICRSIAATTCKLEDLQHELLSTLQTPHSRPV